MRKMRKLKADAGVLAAANRLQRSKTGEKNEGCGGKSKKIHGGREERRTVNGRFSGLLGGIANIFYRNLAACI